MYELWYKIRKLALDRPLLSVIESVVGDDKYDDHTSLQRQQIKLSSGSYPASICCGVSNGLGACHFSSRQGGDRVFFQCVSKSRCETIRTRVLQPFVMTTLFLLSESKRKWLRCLENSFSLVQRELCQRNRELYHRKTKKVCSLTSLRHKIITSTSCNSLSNRRKFKFWCSLHIYITESTTGSSGCMSLAISSHSIPRMRQTKTPRCYMQWLFGSRNAI
mmetsp:Transcript_17417/g.33061  ORF Transcript_17417/g.33061 Transcript_17417/m.33061 type:complete len:219 (+) Transcript_17417:46-702(+)